MKKIIHTHKKKKGKRKLKHFQPPQKSPSELTLLLSRVINSEDKKAAHKGDLVRALPIPNGRRTLQAYRPWCPCEGLLWVLREYESPYGGWLGQPHGENTKVIDVCGLMKQTWFQKRYVPTQYPKYNSHCKKKRSELRFFSSAESFVGLIGIPTRMENWIQGRSTHR